MTIARRTAWTASKRKTWTTLTTATGTGSGTVTWTRNATGLAVGTYVDTITVSASGASGSPARVIDTLRITAVPVPLVLAVAPASRNAAAQQGTAAPGDNATVTLSGDNSTTTAWTASKRKTWTTLTTASGTGSGTVTWTRNATGLAVGTYVDTITVSATGASGSPARVIDTLRITAVPVPLVLAVSPGSRNAAGTAGHRRPGRQRHRDAERRQQHDHGLDGQQAEDVDHAHHLEWHRQRHRHLDPQRHRPRGRHLCRHHHRERQRRERLTRPRHRHAAHHRRAGAAGAGREPRQSQLPRHSRAARPRATTPP